MATFLPLCNISAKPYDEYKTETTIPDVVESSSTNFFITNIVLSALVLIYIYKKCPYMIRINCALCVLSYALKFFPQLEDNDRKLTENICREILTNDLRVVFCWALLLKQNTKVIFSMLALSCFIRIWWCRKLSIVKDVSDIGCEQLKIIAKRRKRPMNEFIKDTFRFKTKVPMPPVYPNGWFSLLESKYLKVGEVKHVLALGQSFAVFRGQNGKAYVLNAICPHLGANMAAGGQVKGNCLECPFHKWVFNGEDGVCVNVPYTENNIPAKSKTKTWHCCEKHGCVYVWYHAEGEPPSWKIPSISEIADGSWHFGGKTEHIVHCHIQEIPENGPDTSHFEALHTCLNFNLRGHLQEKPWLVTHKWGATWKPCLDSGQTHTTELNLSHVIQMFNIPLSFTRMNLKSQQIGPAIVHLRFRTIFGNGILIQNVTPEQPLQQKVVHHMYIGFTFPQLFANMLIMGENNMISRDIAIWNNKKFLKNPILLKEDKLINVFRRWYAQFYSENSPTLDSIQQGNLDW